MKSQQEELKDRFLKCRSELDITQEQLADISNVNQKVISKIETGRVKVPKKLKDLARALKTTPEYLLFGSTSPNITQNELRTYPLLSEISAGEWCCRHDESLKVAEAQIPCSIPIGKNSFCMRVKGKSMVSISELSFPPGTIIFADPDKKPKNGDFVIAATSNNHITFKQYIIDGNKIYLQPLNHDGYKAQDLRDDMHICAVVVHAEIFLNN